ncbi:hypothetical protein [Ralstonia phage phiRSL1]|uniref:Uncharacterized protein n=1 Tax=Ralstonia phage phiRSL1 TaxID=1980924 RepID=B2ZY20_9CAUD|nr:head-tail connector protein [Ralstonia phage phiRSL1]BAG41563.1 hypothetical protein [Ralstonia phage phiRSL1]
MGQGQCQALARYLPQGLIMATPTPLLYNKDPNQDTIIAADVSPWLLTGETLTSIALLPVSPSTTPALTATLISAPNITPANITLSGGVNGVSYGFQLQVTTNARVLLVQVAASCYSNQQFDPYTAQNPYAYQDLVDQLEVGQSAVGTAVFAFPPQIDPKGGNVRYELLADDGTVFSTGNAFSYVISSNGLANIVKAQCVVVAPTTLPPTLLGQSYQLRYTLELPQSSGIPADPLTGNLGQNTFFQFENITIVDNVSVPLGAQPTVELKGMPAHLSLVTDKMYDNVTLELQANNQTLAGPSPITEYQRTADGWAWSGVLDTTNLTVSLVPYTIVWRYWSSAAPSLVYQEATELFVVNASMLTAMNDVRARINKAHTTLYGAPDMLFPNPTVMTWLRRGADMFNGAYGQFTAFTMTNALGVIREYWLICAEKAALEAQLLAEGEKAFNFQGAAISLDVDRVTAYDNLIGKLQQQLDTELKPIKQNLIIKGVTKGDGSTDPTKLQIGAIGAVGISITNANVWGRAGTPYGAFGLNPGGLT